MPFKEHMGVTHSQAAPPPRLEASRHVLRMHKDTLVHFLRADFIPQRIRDAIKEHTGIDPPKAPPPPRLEAYGSADMAESGPLMSQLQYLYSGEGIYSELPHIMEEYGLA